MGLADQLQQGGIRPIVVASHPRSGTHLLIDTLRLNFPECKSSKWWGQRMDRLYLNLAALSYNAHSLSEKQAIAILNRTARPLIKTHATADFARDIVDGPFRPTPTVAFLGWLKIHAAIFYTYRDGRNALCSFFEMQRRSKRECDVPLSDFMHQRPCGVSRVREWADHVRGWMENPDIFCIAMEELLAHPAVCIRNIADKLKFPCDCQTVRLPRPIRTLTEGRMQRLLSRCPESTALICPHAGDIDWRHYFSPADREFFASESGDLLAKLGYEEDHRWLNPAHDGEARSPAGFFATPQAPSPPSHFRAAVPAYA